MPPALGHVGTAATTAAGDAGHLFHQGAGVEALVDEILCDHRQELWPSVGHGGEDDDAAAHALAQGVAGLAEGGGGFDVDATGGDGNAGDLDGVAGESPAEAARPGVRRRRGGVGRR